MEYIQREELLPSEKAFAYKMKMDAMKRQGIRTDLTSCQNGTKFRADAAMAEQIGESARSIQRYIRLTELIPDLLDYVDKKRLQFTVAVDISYIDKEIQTWLFEYIKENGTVARALTLQEKNKNYMTALKAGGCGHARIIFRHILRNILPSVIALATMEIGSIILSIAGFSFIGLGVQAPTPEWGIMLSDSKSYIQTYPSLMFYPGILIMIIVLAFNYLGEGIQNGTAQK